MWVTRSASPGWEWTVNRGPLGASYDLGDLFAKVSRALGPGQRAEGSAMERERGEQPNVTWESAMELLDDLDEIRRNDDDERLTRPA